MSNYSLSEQLAADRKPGEWKEKYKVNGLVYIAGPCSAESREQVLRTAEALRDTPVRFFRAGVWKPRTRPGNFEGLGEKALPWLKEVQERTGLLPAVEVANATHVRLAAQYKIPVLWIGARTTVNPFTVQEIADAIQLYDKEVIVWIKNPVNPDTNLWIGAMERIYAAGVRSIGLIHRGFSSYAPSDYRNPPDWQIPVEIKTRFPHIPLINDPSHICGRRDCIAKVAQTALDLQFDGLMIETHPEPELALSDAQQQLTPFALKELFVNLQVRQPGFISSELQDKLEELRNKIDEIDEKLVEYLYRRNEIIRLIAVEKKKRNVAVLQPERWREIRQHVSGEANNRKLNIPFILRIFDEIHQESIREQEKIIHKKD